jgi:hypothetical protein
MGASPSEFATGTVRFGGSDPIPVSSFTSDFTPTRSAEPFEAGSLEVSGTLDMELSDEGVDALAGLLGYSVSPRYGITCVFPEDAGKRCPVCKEPAWALAVEGVRIADSGPAWNPDGSVSYALVGFDESGYRCEPCGHRFRRDGKEIDA